MTAKRFLNIGAILLSALAGVAALPYQLGDLAVLIPPEWKVLIFKSALVATIILRVVHELLPAKVQPIETHPDFAKLAETYGWNAQARKFPQTQEKTQPK